MPQHTILREASFENATRYHVVKNAIALTCTVIFIPLLVVVLPIIAIVMNIYYSRISCTLTHRALVVKRGVLNRVEQTIPLDRITDLAVSQGPIMRLCEVEGLMVETAGQSGTGQSLVHLIGIRDAREFRDAVMQQREALRGGATTPIAEPNASGDDVLLEIRDTLVRIEGVLREGTEARRHKGTE
ncbi:MAG: PH domain-containing protein [Planctomycetota bacterium]